jgi:hypothetical protein
MTERRIHPRVKASHPALYLAHVYPRPRVATTVDLSMGGTRIETPYSLISGEALEISIAIHPQVVKCTGKVVHILDAGGENLTGRRRCEAGIQFEEMSEDDKLYLGDYLARLMKQHS